MKNIRLALLIVLGVVTLASCRKVVGEGPQRTEQRSTGNFTGVELGVPGDLYYTPSNQFLVEITAQQNILDVIETDVDGGKLKIKVRHGVNLRNHESITVKISAPDLRILGVNGSGNVHALVPYSAPSLDLYVNGSGNVQVAGITTSRLEAKISGSGNIRVHDGETDYEDLAISGSGDIDLTGVIAEEAKTSTSGSGDMRVHVISKLDTKISGSGSVYYKGNPIIKMNVSGSGRVTPM
ncbi:MAG: DUF2807 domain-containing protein [Chitinophagaceae bacterium]|nr:MAG: DUF2807 domain-containing protein [Chitinophagaceae bacterium]